MSFTSTLLLANTTCAAWLAVYHWLLEPPEERAIQLWRHDSSDFGAAAAAEGGAGGQQGRAAVIAAEQQRRRQEGGGRGTGAQVPVRAEAAAEATEGEADLQRAEAGSEEQQRLLGRDGGSGLEQQQQRQGQPQGWQLNAGDLEESSEEWKPSKAGRMTWRERLHRTGGQGAGS